MKKENSPPPAVFIAGALGLDLLNSLARPVDALVDWWSNGEDLLSWMKQAQLLTDRDIAGAKSNMSAKELDRAAGDARELREWYRGFVRANMGKSLKPDALTQLGPLKKVLEMDEVFWSLEPGDSTARFQLRARRRWRKPESLLAPIAENMARFISSADFRNVKACQGHNCILFFLDQSRQNARRWCSMAVCGNRAKQEAHLARLKNKRKSPVKHRGKTGG
jgi:predicted RNA-binding Zn ribbon-like protein